MADIFCHLYRPTAPIKFASLPEGVRWKWIESPRALAPNMLGLPPSKHEFGVIATDKEIGHYERNKANLELLDRPIPAAAQPPQDTAERPVE